jgi:hypothetical protein
MEEFIPFNYYNPDLMSDYRKAVEAHKKAQEDYSKATALFLRYQDADSRKILSDTMDNLQNAKRLRTELALRLADNVIDPAAWKKPSDDRRIKAKEAVEAIRSRTRMKWFGNEADCELKA